jgi:transposase-like protein
MRTYTRSYRRRHEPIVDGLPEHMHFTDTGCEASGACLDCPLPRCKFDDPNWYQAYKRQGRDQLVLDAYHQGLSVFQVARQLNVSTRTVHRVLARSREAVAA